MPLRQKILLALLAVVSLYYVISTFYLDSNTATRAPAASAPRTAMSTLQGGAGGVPPAGGQNRRDAATLPGSTAAINIDEWGPRDPFYRFVNEVETEVIQAQKLTATGLILEGIQWANGKALIIINDELLRVNDIINGMKLIRVGGDFVVLKKGSSQITLRLGGNNE